MDLLQRNSHFKEQTFEKILFKHDFKKFEDKTLLFDMREVCRREINGFKSTTNVLLHFDS